MHLTELVRPAKQRMAVEMEFHLMMVETVEHVCIFEHLLVTLQL